MAGRAFCARFGGTIQTVGTEGVDNEPGHIGEFGGALRAQRQVDKPGARHRGGNDAERAKNLQVIKAWLGEGAWNLNRWKARGDVPGITMEQIDKVKAKY